MRAWRPVRFNNLARMIGGASKKMITERLRQLEVQGPVLYEISDLGRTALGVLDESRRWRETLPDQTHRAAP